MRWYYFVINYLHKIIKNYICKKYRRMAFCWAVLARHRGTGGLPAPPSRAIVKTTFIFNRIKGNSLYPYKGNLQLKTPQYSTQRRLAGAKVCAMCAIPVLPLLSTT